MASDVVGAAKIKLEFDDKSLDASTKTADKSLSAWTVAAGNMITKAFDKTISAVGDMLTTGMNFDKAMSQVAATMGTTVDQISELRDYAKEMGSTTAFSANQAAEALNYMALAGYDAEKSMAMLPKVLNLAAAGNMELATASDMVTDAQSALGLTMDQTDTLIDQMAKTSSKSNTSVSQLGEAILTVGGTAKNLAGGTKELNMMLGILADNGIKGAEGGTALRNVILSLSAPTDKAAKLIEELGLQVYDAEGNMRPLNDTFGDLQKILGTMDQQKQTEVLSTIFNKVDLKSANALLGTTTERFNELGIEIDGAAGSAQQMADTQLDNLGGDVTLLQSAFESLQISLSETVAPILRNVVDLATGFVTWMGENQGVVIGVLAGITTAMIAYKWEAIAAAAVNPFSWVGIAMTAVGALVGWVIQNFGEVGEFIGGICQGIGDFFSSTFGWMGNIIGEFGAFFGEIFQGIGDFFSNTFGWMFDIFDGIFSAMSDIVGVFGDFFGGIFQGIGDFFNNTFGWIFDIFNAIFGDMTDGVGDFGTFFNDIFQGIGDFFNNTFGWIFDIFSTIFGWMGDTLGWFGEFFSGIFQGIGDFFNNTFGWMFDVFNNVFSGISNALSGFADFFRGIFQGISDFVQGIIDGISGFFQGLWDGIQTGFQAISDFITTIFETIGNVIKAPFNGIISAINGVIDMINSIKIPDWVPLIGGAGFNIPKIPLLAEGGLASSATMAIFGEAGTEAVLPLKNNTDNWSGLLAETLMDSMEERGGAGGGKEVVINNYNTVSNDYDAQKLSDLMVRQIRRAA